MLVKGAMSKLLALVILGLMAVQLIRPLGLPGLRRRRDFWKLAVVALAAISATVLLSHGDSGPRSQGRVDGSASGALSSPSSTAPRNAWSKRHSQVETCKPGTGTRAA